MLVWPKVSHTYEHTHPRSPEEERRTLVCLTRKAWSLQQWCFCHSRFPFKHWNLTNKVKRMIFSGANSRTNTDTHTPNPGSKCAKHHMWFLHQTQVGPARPQALLQQPDGRRWAVGGSWRHADAGVERPGTGCTLLQCRRYLRSADCGIRVPDIFSGQRYHSEMRFQSEVPVWRCIAFHKGGLGIHGINLAPCTWCEDVEGVWHLRFRVTHTQETHV